MSTEQIAEVIQDVRCGNYRSLADPKLTTIFHEIAEPACNTVVDSTAIYRQLAATVTEYNFYDDFPSMAPPWNEAAIVYENQHGNVIVMCILTGDRDAGHNIGPWEPDPNDNKVVDWQRVRWVMEVPLLLGGTDGNGRRITTTAFPMFWRVAVYDDGELADVRWVNIAGEDKYPISYWDMALLVFESTINFMGCRNVEYVETAVPRPIRRRLLRRGPEVRLGVLHVRPVSRGSRGNTAANPGSVPLHSVVGHRAHYGNCCPTRHEPRGLLFGKLEGRFWIPQHARGQRGAGEVVHEYIVETG